MGIQQALLAAGGGGIVNPLAGGTVVTGIPSAAYVHILTNGAIETSNGSGGSWFDPTTTGIGTGYYVNVAVDSGDAMDTTPGSGWYELTSNRYYAYDGGVAKAGSWIVSISSDSSGTPVVTSGTFSVNLV